MLCFLLLRCDARGLAVPRRKNPWSGERSGRLSQPQRERESALASESEIERASAFSSLAIIHLAGAGVGGLRRWASALILSLPLSSLSSSLFVALLWLMGQRRHAGAPWEAALGDMKETSENERPRKKIAAAVLSRF